MMVGNLYRSSAFGLGDRAAFRRSRYVTMTTDEPASVFGFRIEQRFPNETYPLGRVCDVEQCGTELSRYNPGSVCAYHEPASSLTRYRSSDYMAARR